MDFESNADNLSADDNDTLDDIYVRDLATNSTTFVSRQSSGQGGAAADSGAFDPALSGDGHFVRRDRRTELSTIDGDAEIDVFVSDLQTSTTLLASRTRARAMEGSAATATATSHSLSSDGRFVVFDSQANNLSSVDNDTFSNAFVTT